MKALAILAGLFAWLLPVPARAQQGLKGEYYTGTNFEHKVFTRIDPQISFNWVGRTPGPGMPESYYSIRWTGKLLPPATGVYKFFAKVDDGIRVWVGNKKVIDSWQLNDSENFTGSITLEAGHYYDLRVDYFNAMLEGEIQLYWQRPDARKLVQNPFATSGEPITAQYFFQKAPPVATPPKTNKASSHNARSSDSYPAKNYPSKALDCRKAETNSYSITAETNSRR